MNLRETRESKGLTQAQLSKLAEVPIGTISRIENQKVAFMQPVTKRRLCRAMGIQPEEMEG